MSTENDRPAWIHEQKLAGKLVTVQERGKLLIDIDNQSQLDQFHFTHGVLGDKLGISYEWCKSKSSNIHVYATIGTVKYIVADEDEAIESMLLCSLQAVFGSDGRRAALDVKRIIDCNSSPSILVEEPGTPFYKGLPPKAMPEAEHVSPLAKLDIQPTKTARTSSKVQSKSATPKRKARA